MAGTNPEDPTKKQAKKLSYEIAERLMEESSYFVSVDKGCASVYVSLPYRDVTILEVEMALTDEQNEKVKNIRQLSGGNGFKTVQVVVSNGTPR